MGKAYSKRKIVGSIGIEVNPVLDGFRREVKRSVEAAMAGYSYEVDTHVDGGELRRELNRAIRMAEATADDIKVGVDAEGLRRQFKRLQKQIRKDSGFDDLPAGLGRIGPYQELQKKLKEAYLIRMEPDRSFFRKTRTLLDGFFKREYVGKVDFELDADTDEGWAKIESAMNRAFLDHKNYKFKIDVVPDLESGRIDGALNELRRELRRRAMGEWDEVTIDVKPDMDKGELRHIGRKLQEFKDKWDDTELEFKLGLDKSARYITAARLMYLARDRWVKFHPFLDNGAVRTVATTLAALSGGRLVSDLSRNIWDWVKNIDKAVPLFGSVASLAAGIAAATTQFLKHTVGVAGSLGHIIQMVGLLGPGFVIAGGMLTSAFVVPMFKAKDHIQHILDDWTALSDEMGSGFWTSAMHDFESAHRRAFDGFRKDMTDLSTAAGRHFGRVSDSISRIVTPRFHEWVSHANAGLEELGSHSDGLARVVDILGRHGSAGLERFLGWLGRVTTQYADWLTEAERTGKLVDMIDRGVLAMRELGRATKNFGKVFGGIYEVARDQGGANMTNLADGLDRWQEVTHSAPFQNGLRRWFSGMSEAWTMMKRQSAAGWRSFWGDWSRLVDNTGKLMGESAGKLMHGAVVSLSGAKFNSGMHNFFQGLSDGLSRLYHTWPRVSGMLGDLLTFMGSLGRGFSPVIASTLDGFARAAERLVGPLSSIVEITGPKMANTIELTSRVLTPFLEVLARMVEGLAKVPGLVESLTVGFMGAKALTGIISVGSAAKVAFAGLGKDAGKAATKIKELFALMVGADATSGLRGFTGGIRGAGSVMGGFKAALGGAASAVLAPAGIVAALAAAGAAVGHYADRDLQRVTAANEGLRESFRNLANGVGSSVEEMQDYLKSAFSEDMWGFGLNLERMLSGSVDFLGKGKFEQFLTRSGLSGLFGGAHSKTAMGGDLLNDSLRELAAMAPKNSGAVVDALQMMREAYIATGGSAEEFTELVQYGISEYPALASGLYEYAGTLGYAANESGMWSVLLTETNHKLTAQQREMEAAAASTVGLTTALDNMVPSYDLSYDAASSLVENVRAMGSAFVDFSAAATDSNGQVITSMDELTANLDAQVEAHKNWADNMAAAAERGIDQGVLMELSKLPGGAQYIQQLVDASDEEFATWSASLNAAGGVLAGELDHMSAEFQDMASKVGVSFSELKGITEVAFADMGIEANLAGVNTVAQLAEALASNGVTLSESGGQLVFEFSSGIGNSQSYVYDAASGMVDEAVSAVDDNQGAARAAGAKIPEGAAQGVTENGGLVADATTQVMTNAVELAKGSFVGAAGIGTQFVADLGSEIMSNTAAEIASQGMAERVVSTTKAAMGVASPSTIGKQIGADWNAGIRIGIAGSAGGIATAAHAAGQSALAAARSVAGGFLSVGHAMGAGMRSGILAAAGSVAAAAASVVSNAIAAAKRAADINSPSKKAIPIGEGISQGVEVGILNDAPDAAAAAGTMVASTLAVLDSGMARASSLVGPQSRGVSAGVVQDVRWESPSQGVQTVMVDPRSFQGAVFPLRVGEREFEGFVEDVSAGVVQDFEDARVR